MKTYKLMFDQKSTYLHVIVTGRNTKENVKGYLQEILHECITRGCSKVLIEERLEGPRLGMIDVFDIASKGDKRTPRILDAIAYVDVNAEGNLMQFAENVAVNRAFPVAVFPTTADAEKWLLDKDRREAEHAAADPNKLRP